MKQFAVIGDPVSHSLSPLLHGEVFRQLGFKATFVKIHVKKVQLSNFMIDNKLEGFNVTIPHKQAVIPFLDELDKASQIIGAVNCVYKGKGYNTDCIGFLNAMDLNHIDMKDKNCLILGAGGAARAVAYALVQIGVNSISVRNRTKGNTDRFLRWLQFIFPANKTNENHQVIINCTPLGMWSDTKSMPNIKIDPGQVLVDTIYNPLETAWLNKGKAIGAKTIGGLDMFIAQGLESADIWFSEKISEIIKLESIKKVLKTELC